MLSSPVEEIKGIGPKTAEILKKAGIKTIRDFFYNLPRDYENFEAPTSIAAIRPGKIVVKGKIDSLSTRRAKRRNLSITEGVVRDNTGAIKVVWFNQSYRVRQFSPDKEYYFKGTYELKNGRFQLTSPSAALVSDVEVGAELALCT
jgi:ATP-dependent DNA helicase RecG